jgi:hypothetical protein
MRSALLVLALAAAVLLAPGMSRAADETFEAPVKAAFLYHFSRFIEWPAHATADRGEFVICVVGKDPFGAVLDETVAGKKVGGRRLAVLREPDPETASRCAIVFVGTLAPERLSALLAELRERPVLLVGDSDFLRRGGTVQFTRDGNHVRIDIDPKRAEARGLRISSRLLSLARLVDAEGGAK